MDYIYAAIFGFVQGITEFLPISSSGHLVILHELISLPIKNEITFDVIMHSATLFAVLWFFRQEIRQLLKSWLLSLGGQKDNLSRISWLIILGTIPAALVGWLFGNYIEAVFRSPLIVAIMLAIIGGLFIVFEKISSFQNDLEKLNWRQALIIGLAQVAAFIPGTSRSGVTIIAGLGVGLKREEAIKFSFLLSVPIIAGAVIKKIPQTLILGLSGEELMILSIGFIFSFLTGFLAIKYFLKFSKNNSLHIFAYYRFILAAILLIIGLTYLPVF